LRYAQHVAERFNIREHITFNTSVEPANYDEDAAHGQGTTDQGEGINARYVVMATGNL